MAPKGADWERAVACVTIFDWDFLFFPLDRVSHSLAFSCVLMFLHCPPDTFPTAVEASTRAHFCESITLTHTRALLCADRSGPHARTFVNRSL
jgi:hypothetical protein